MSNNKIEDEGKVDITENEANIIKRTEPQFVFSIITRYINLINDSEININQVDGKNLSKIIEYLRHYENSKPKEIPKPLTNSDLKQILPSWDFNFINSLSLEECIDLANAATYLHINGLIELSTVKLASEMMNGTVEQVREKFGIKSDMTEEEMKHFEKYKLDY